MNEQTNGQTKPPELDRQTSDRGDCDILPNRASKQNKDDSGGQMTNSHSNKTDDRVSSKTRSRGVLRSVSFDQSK